jgi:hypothetical protein
MNVEVMVTTGGTTLKDNIMLLYNPGKYGWTEKLKVLFI